MKFRGIFAILAVVAMAATANAAKLVVTNVQSGGLIPVGSKVFTIAVQLEPSDGTGVLGISITLPQQVTNPQQLATGSGGVKTIQAVENAGNIAAARAADTWWYSSGADVAGQLVDGDLLPVVGDPNLNGPGLSPNPASLIWSPQVGGFKMSATGGVGVTATTVFEGTGLWGDPISGDPTIAAASIVGAGKYPLLQIMTNGNVLFNTNPSQGIAAPNGQLYSVLGGPAGTGAGAYLSFNPTADPLAINAVPEPSTLALAGLGLIGALVARRRRK